MYKDINNYNTKGDHHGYQEWYGPDGKMWLRGNWRNGVEIGYEECNDVVGAYLGELGTIVIFYIR